MAKSDKDSGGDVKVQDHTVKGAESKAAPVAAKAAEPDNGKFLVRVKRGIHCEGKENKVYTPESGWFWSDSDLVTSHGQDKFEAYNPKATRVLPPPPLPSDGE